MVNSKFSVLSNLLAPSDPKYIKWRESLKKRPAPWSARNTKKNFLRAKRISETFKKNKIDNFSEWRTRAKKLGLIISQYPPYSKNTEFAYLTGIILGDGNIYQFPRTQKLEITLGTDKPDLITFVARITSKVIRKEAKIRGVKDSNCVKVYIYQKKLSERLSIPTGKRIHRVFKIPMWIWRSDRNLKAYLKGLYEAEAYLSIHLPTSTYNFAFVNHNKSLLKNVEISLKRFGLHPEIRPTAVRLRRKEEVKYFKQLINFREYFIAG